MARLPQPGSDNGEWGEILNDYLSQEHHSDGTHSSSNIKFKVDSIADLKVFDRKGKIECVTVLGYYSAGDGGGGDFYFDAGSVDVDNGGTIIQSSVDATGRWKRILNKGSVNVKWFGAKGDGVTDDTVAIQTAFTFVSSFPEKAIYFSAGVYSVSSTISFTGASWGVRGESKAVTTILAATNANIFEIDCTSAIVRYGEIRGITFKRESATYNATKAIYIKATTTGVSGLRHWTFADLRFAGVEYGIYLDDAGDCVTSLGTNMTGGHGFNNFENLEVPIQMDARYPYAALRFAGAPGPHTKILGGQFRARYASVMVGNGGQYTLTGDFLMSGAHCVLGDYGVELLGATDANAYRYNWSITGCQFDVLNIATIKADHIGIARFIGNNGILLPAVLTNMNGYVIDDGLNWTFSQTCTLVDTEGATATDNLDTINGGTTGDIIILRSVNSTRDVVLKHGTGNLRLDGSADKTLDTPSDTITLLRSGNFWLQTSFSNNA